MNLEQRLLLLERLGAYMISGDSEWAVVKEKASYENGWFVPEFVELQCSNIASQFLSRSALLQVKDKYQLSDHPAHRKVVGVIMAGNLPLVGIHDFISVFITGHIQKIKLSSKDMILQKHLVEKMMSWDARFQDYVSFAQMLKDCDAYIATGSNNSSRYFDYYFQKYPHIIRRNRTSVAIITGDESKADLESLADDVYTFFGLGCRNVTKLFVPRGYDFVPLLEAFKKYNHLFDHNKYKNNYDYQLAILIINGKYYMTNGSIILVESPAVFSPISQLHYEYFDDINSVKATLLNNEDIQCIVGRDFTPFGQSQCPTIFDFADGVDTLKFLQNLS